MEEWVERGGAWVGMVESEEKAGPGVEPGRCRSRAQGTGRPPDPAPVHGVLVGERMPPPSYLLTGRASVKGEEGRGRGHPG